MGKFFKIAAKASTYFIGIVPTSEATQEISSFRNPSELHMTLAYLGPKTPTDVELVKQQLYNLTKTQKMVKVESGGYNTFDGKYPHLSIKDNSSLNNLYDSVNTLFDIKTTRAFKPHITVNTQNNFLPTGRDIEFDAKQIVLFESTGGNYKPIAAFPLQDLTLADKVKSFFAPVGKFFTNIF